MREILCAVVWAALADAGDLLPLAADRVFEGIGAERGIQESLKADNFGIGYLSSPDERAGLD